MTQTYSCLLTDSMVMITFDRILKKKKERSQREGERGREREREREREGEGDSEREDIVVQTVKALA